MNYLAPTKSDQFFNFKVHAMHKQYTNLLWDRTRKKVSEWNKIKSFLFRTKYICVFFSSLCWSLTLYLMSALSFHFLCHSICLALWLQVFAQQCRWLCKHNSYTLRTCWNNSENEIKTTKRLMELVRFGLV